MKLQVLIIGYGKVGSVLAKLLSQQRPVTSTITQTITKVTCATARPIHDHPLPRCQFKKVDAASITELNKLLEETSPTIVVNCSLPRYNENILKSCWKRSCHYLDLASLGESDTRPTAPYPYRLEQFAYHHQFQRKKLLGLINAGLSPGLTNLLAAEGASFLDSVNHLKVRLLEECKTKRPFIAWSKETLLAQMSLKPVVYERGHYALKNRFSGEEFFTFSFPDGRKEVKKVWLVAQEEAETIPLYIKVNKCDVKSHDNYHDLAAVANAPDTPDKTMLQDLQRAFFAATIEAVGMEAGGQARGQINQTNRATEQPKKQRRSQRFSVVFPPQKEINQLNLGANFITYPTALMAALFITAFPIIKERGILSPEGLSQEARRSILSQLGKVNGISMLQEGKNFS